MSKADKHAGGDDEDADVDILSEKTMADDLRELDAIKGSLLALEKRLCDIDVLNTELLIEKAHLEREEHRRLADVKNIASDLSDLQGVIAASSAECDAYDRSARTQLSKFESIRDTVRGTVEFLLEHEARIVKRPAGASASLSATATTGGDGAGADTELASTARKRRGNASNAAVGAPEALFASATGEIALPKGLITQLRHYKSMDAQIQLAVAELDGYRADRKAMLELSGTATSTMAATEEGPSDSSKRKGKGAPRKRPAEEDTPQPAAREAEQGSSKSKRRRSDE